MCMCMCIYVCVCIYVHLENMYVPVEESIVTVDSPTLTGKLLCRLNKDSVTRDAY